MLSTRRGIAATLLSITLLTTACSGEPPPDAAPPSTVATATAEASVGIVAVNVGIVLNTDSPTAARDARLVDVMAASAEAVSGSQPVEVHIETVTISELDDAPAAVSELANRGVTVIATSCDDSSMPTVVDASIAEQLLAVTGCVAIPKPELDVSHRLFIDLASLDDSPDAIANWAEDQGFESLAVLSSALIPDVDQTCLDIEQAATATPRNIEISAKASFLGLVDDADVLVTSLADGLQEADAIVVCALAPALGDVVDELRDGGFDQPVLVPWFGEPQPWNSSSNNIFVFTPSSIHGDDPSRDVLDLYSELESSEAVDVVAADTLSALAAAADTSKSVGSRRLADATRGATVQSISGDLQMGIGLEHPVIRSYRVLEITNGEAAFRETVSG